MVREFLLFFSRDSIARRSADDSPRALNIELAREARASSMGVLGAGDTGRLRSLAVAGATGPVSLTPAPSGAPSSSQASESHPLVARCPSYSSPFRYCSNASNADLFSTLFVPSFLNREYRSVAPGSCTSARSRKIGSPVSSNAYANDDQS